MISAEAASVAIKIVKGVIKLKNRIDDVLEEKAAVQAPIALPAPTLNLSPPIKVMVKHLESLLEDSPGVLTAPQRTAVQNAVNSRKKPALLALVNKHIDHLPGLFARKNLDLNAAFMRELRETRPEWAADPDLVMTAFYIGSGEDFRKKSYTWRLAFTTVDTLAELGAENTALFARDPRLQKVVGSILKRFGEADVQQIDSTKAALKAALAATLNAALEMRGEFKNESKLLGAVLDSLVVARSAMPSDQRDDFFIGLLNGKGYPALVGSVLESSASILRNQDADLFRDAASGLLKQVADIVTAQPDFQHFFQDHWGDLMRAGLSAVSTNGPNLLGDQPLLGKVLQRVAGDLANHPQSKLLSTETLFGIVNCTAAVVAANPDLTAKFFSTNAAWIDELVVSVAHTVADDGITSVFSKQGIDSLFRDSFATFANHPELLASDSTLAGALIGGILKKLSTVDSFATRDLAKAAVEGALESLADNPALAGLGYPDLVGSLAGRIGHLVKEKKITGIQAKDLLRVGLAAVSLNPTLFLELKKDLTENVLEAVVGAASKRPGVLVAGASLVRIGQSVSSALARTGKVALTLGRLDDLEDQLQPLLEAGLTRAEEELGRILTLADVPGSLGLLVEAWVNEKVGAIDPLNTNFIALYSNLVTRAAA